MKSTQSPGEVVVMDMTIRGNSYSGPNYRSAKDEARATRKARSLSWFDSWAFALLLMCVLSASFYFSTHNPMRSECHTTQTWCSVQGGGR